MPAINSQVAGMARSYKITDHSYQHTQGPFLQKRSTI